MPRAPPISTLFPYTTLFRSLVVDDEAAGAAAGRSQCMQVAVGPVGVAAALQLQRVRHHQLLLRSEEHTSELQSPDHLVCSLLPDIKVEDGRGQAAGAAEAAS